jgi:anti-sigma28 factor (negative regulator of flagellin synthesis)
MQTGHPRFANPSPARSREAARALAVALAAPDVRADRVVDAQQRIARGTYKLMAEVVAMGLLGLQA